MSGRNTAEALWIVEKRRCAVRREVLTEPRDGEILIESLYGAISRGTERLVFEGRVPDSEFARMAGPHQGGGFGFPVKYGYAVVGRAPDGGMVFCLHPHQDRFLIAAEETVPVPDDVPPSRAVLGANMETALNIVWDARVAPGDRVVVIGGGLVGLLVAYLASRVPATRTVLVDRDPKRAPVAAALSLVFAAPDALPEDCDVAVNVSASDEGLSSAIAAAGQEARVVEASWYGDRPATIPLGGAFHSRRLSIVSSQVGQVPAGRRARWTRRRRLETALALLHDPALDALITGETAFNELAGVYAGILDDAGTLCHRIRYD